MAINILLPYYITVNIDCYYYYIPGILLVERGSKKKKKPSVIAFFISSGGDFIIYYYFILFYFYCPLSSLLLYSLPLPYSPSPFLLTHTLSLTLSLLLLFLYAFLLFYIDLFSSCGVLSPPTCGFRLYTYSPPPPSLKPSPWVFSSAKTQNTPSIATGMSRSHMCPSTVLVPPMPR